jgi:hypothetical protein
MRRPHLLRRHDGPGPSAWLDILVAWLIIGAAFAFYAIMMWWIATAAG